MAKGKGKKQSLIARSKASSKGSKSKSGRVLNTPPSLLGPK